MKDVFAAEEITLDLLIEVLEDAGVACEKHPEGSAYLPGGAFPLWLQLHAAERCLLLKTWCSFADHVHCCDAIGFTNLHNASQSLIQLSVTRGDKDLWGYYYLSWRAGLLRRQLLCAISEFSVTFRYVLRAGEESGLLRDPTRAHCLQSGSVH